MSENFEGNENKAFLWQLLFEQGAFNDIPNEYVSNIKESFDSKMIIISRNNKELSLTEKNKHIISEMVNLLPIYKKKPMNVIKPLEELKIELDVDLKNKNDEFLQLIKRPTPKEIDFSDKNDEPMDVNNVNTMLNRMMEIREKELNQITPSQIPKEISNKVIDINTETPENINIDDKSSSIKDEIKNYITDDKRVSFKFDEIQTNDNISSINTTEVLDYLKTIINNQNKILLLLENTTITYP